MFLADPPSTAYDLRFRLLGIPVRIHPLFWLVSLFMGMNAQDPKLVALWVIAVFVSILIHEFGHAAVMRAFGGQPRIVLYSFGGMAIDRARRQDPLREMLILFAGPGAGFVLALLVVVLTLALGGQVTWQIGWPYIVYLDADVPERMMLSEFLSSMLYINVFWGLVNLLPIFPLDGGQFHYQLLTYLRTREPLLQTLFVSIVAAIAVAAYGFIFLHSFYLAIFFGYLAYSNYTMLQQLTGRGGGWR